MIKGFIVNKSKINVKPIAVIAGSKGDDGYFTNTVLGYIGQNPVVIKTNLNQNQWELFCEGKLSREELIKYA